MEVYFVIDLVRLTMVVAAYLHETMTFTFQKLCFHVSTVIIVFQFSPSFFLALEVSYVCKA
jgi:hypothetical protein